MLQIPILAYHGVSNLPDNKYNVQTESFSEQMEWLNQSGFKTLDQSDLFEFKGTEYYKSGSYFVLTFDDGHISNYEFVMPVLEKYGFKAIFFITTGLIEKESNFMDWVKVKELHRKGHSIQCHGHFHMFLNRLKAENVDFELQESRKLIKEHIGVLPDTFSCPGGRYNDSVIKIAKKAGYKRIFTSQPVYYDLQNDLDKYLIGRWFIDKDTDLARFKKIMAMEKCFLRSNRIKYQAKNILKTLIGDRLYQYLFRKFKLG